MDKKVTEQQLIVYGIYSHIIESFQHYNRIQVSYRLFVSTWLLATFIGIGYTLSSLEVNLPFDPLISISIICFASFTIIVLIGYMDLIVTERSIGILVHESLDLEKTNPWLPQIVNTCDKINNLLGFINSKSIFYLGCSIIIFITLISTATFFIMTGKYSFFPILFILCLIVTIFIATYWLLFSNKRINPYIKIQQKYKGK